MPIENPDNLIVLQYPVTVKGQLYNEIGLRRPKVKDLRHVSGPNAGADPISAQNRFLSALSEVPEVVFEELDLDDAEKFTQYADGFMKGARPQVS